MDVVAIAALAFAPGIFWLWYFYRKDRIEPEPKKMLAKAFFLGMIAVFPAAAIEFPFSATGILILAVVVAPIVEEILKYLFVRYGAYRDAEFNEPMDGIIYACAVALGFASVENLAYLLQAYLDPDKFSGFISISSSYGRVSIIFVLRALLTVPGHALWSSMWGYALGWAKFSDEERGKKLIRNGIILSIIFHSLFNFLLVTSAFSALGMLILIPVLWKTVNRRISQSISGSPFYSRESEFTED